MKIQLQQLKDRIKTEYLELLTDISIDEKESVDEEAVNEFNAKIEAANTVEEVIEASSDSVLAEDFDGMALWIVNLFVEDGTEYNKLQEL